MDTTDRQRERLIIGVGGVAMLVSLFLPWAKGGGISETGWEFSTTSDILFAITGVIAIWAAVSGGRIGLFRPDVSLNGAADVLGVVSTVLLVWLVVFDWPEGATRGAGVILALGAAIATMGAAGDYRPLRGAPWFPRLDRD
jgi:hypothetical protein